MKDHEVWPPLPIQYAKGVWLYDFNHKGYLDAIGSWWVNLFGHCNPRINQAIEKQLSQLEHVMFAGFTHPSIITLSEQIIALAPPGLTRCFYTDCGSAAIEVALKMSFQYWQNINQPQKNKFVSLSNSYHGETIGALSVGDVAVFKKTYTPLLIDVITAPGPDGHDRLPDEPLEIYSLRCFERLKTILAERHHEIAGIFIEPLVQCAGNMQMYSPIYLKKLRQACDEYHIHLIADEIAVGFGRTGTFFACEQAHITPDFLCTGKGLTGGYLPMSITLTTEAIYQAFYTDFHAQKAFLHSHSYSGNALACAAALATLDIFKTDQVIENNQHLATYFKQSSQAALGDHPHITALRQTGMILACDIVSHQKTKTPFLPSQRIGRQIAQEALEMGLVIRPMGDTVYYMTPYTITYQEIDMITHITKMSVSNVIERYS
jgi:adenosylmethionine-8-amino-7-oxononanoate aminotransferase